MWQQTVWGQIRIGVLTPHADVGPESEFPRTGARRDLEN
jgi:hypothetical protein